MNWPCGTSLRRRSSSPMSLKKSIVACGSDTRSIEWRNWVTSCPSDGGSQRRVPSTVSGTSTEAQRLLRRLSGRPARVGGGGLLPILPRPHHVAFGLGDMARFEQDRRIVLGERQCAVDRHLRRRQITLADRQRGREVPVKRVLAGALPGKVGEAPRRLEVVLSLGGARPVEQREPALVGKQARAGERAIKRQPPPCPVGPRRSMHCPPRRAFAACADRLAAKTPPPSRNAPPPRRTSRRPMRATARHR